MIKEEICAFCGETFEYENYEEDEEYFGEIVPWLQFFIKGKRFAASQYGYLCPKCASLPEPRVKII